MKVTDLNHSILNAAAQSRRDFLTTSASGLGGVALSSMLLEDGLLGGEYANPMAPRQPHFEPKAKSCIFIFMAGAPSLSLIHI